MIILYTSILGAVVLAVIYFRQIYSNFRKYGVKHITPLPLVGNLARLYLGLDHFADHITKIYNKFPKERFVGRFELINEVVIIRDLDLIEKIATKDFECFDHRSLLSESKSFFARNLLALNGHEWKEMRNILSPAFTSSKIRKMVPFIVDVSEHMIAMLKGKMIEANSNEINVDCENLTSCYANDVVVSCAFGVEINSYSDPQNPFYTKGRESITLGFGKMLIYFLMTNVPILAKIFKWDLLSNSCKKFFRNLVVEMIKKREMNQIVRPDLIHLLMKARKGQLTENIARPNGLGPVDEVKKEKICNGRKGEMKMCQLTENIARPNGLGPVDEVKKEKICNGRKGEMKMLLTDDDIVAQVLLFFIEGFGTVSNLMNFLLYELAVNPDVQERLATEIKEHDNKNNGKLDYDSLKNMTYLHQVVLEVMRLWHPSMVIDRHCNRDYNLGKPNKNAEKEFIVKKGTTVTIPIYAINRDPQYFPDPEKFDPERFSAENRHKIHPFSYNPFGFVPRNCIGLKLGHCELKTMIYKILLHMDILPTETTCIPAKLCPKSLCLKLEGGHTLKFRMRS